MKMNSKIIVNIAKNELVLAKGVNQARYAISTSRNGSGNEYGKEQTPLGKHRIAEKIGDGVVLAGIFEERDFKGKISPIYFGKPSEFEEVPCITTRILWLEGLEEGINKGEGIGSYERKIYIHGTPYEYDIGRSASLGCIRMRNKDIIKLFDEIETGDEIYIRT